MDAARKQPSAWTMSYYASSNIKLKLVKIIGME